MNTRSSNFSSLITIIFSVVLLLIMGWWIINFLTVYGGGTKFLTQWLAVRSFATEGIDPYSPTLQSTAEEMAYGHAAITEPKLKFSSPLYSIMVILPFSVISDFKIAATVWSIFLALVILVSLALALKVTGWKQPLILGLLVIAFTLFGFPNFRSIFSGSVLVIAMFFLYLAVILIRVKRYELAGIFLALATIQPRAVFLVVLFILIWSISKRFWPVLVWFLTGLVTLTILGTFFVSDWLIQYLRVIINFKEYYPVISPVSVFSANMPGIGRQLGWGLSLIMVVILLFEWLAARKKDYNWFLWTAGLTLVIGQWSGIPTDPDDFVILLLPLIIILAAWDRRFKRYGKWMAGFSLVVFLVGLWGIFTLISPEINLTQPSRILLFPFPLFLLIGLYWVRWWFIKPQVDFIEEISRLDRF